MPDVEDGSYHKQSIVRSTADQLPSECVGIILVEEGSFGPVEQMKLDEHLGGTENTPKDESYIRNKSKQIDTISNTLFKKKFFFFCVFYTFLMHWEVFRGGYKGQS